jgi:serine phosphatase RsbU (regulator of sigma subunit)
VIRILVAWDDTTEAEVIDSFLNVGENTARVVSDETSLQGALDADKYDIVLFALDFPHKAAAFPCFRRIRQAFPEVAIVGAWRPGDITHVAKFILDGTHSLIARDENRDFIFLLTSILEATHLAAQARRSQVLAEKLREEVESVRQLQESVLPRDLPMPTGYRVAARYEPSQIHVVGDRPVVMAGGDYYDVFSFDGQQFMMVLGDAAGHGVKACLSIMTMHTLMSMIRDRRFAHTAEFVTEINRRLCDSTIIGGEQGGFITLLYCVLDGASHRLQWTSAGHPMPLLQDLATNEVRHMANKEDGGLPLVVTSEWEYVPCEAIIPPNSRVLLYTDGLDEAFPEGGEEHLQFGEKGIIQTLKATRDRPLQEALEQLFHDSNAATHGAGRHDDTSIVLLERFA